MKRKQESKKNSSRLMRYLNESIETVTISTSESESTAKSDVEEICDEPRTAETLSDENVVIIDDKVVLVLDGGKSVYLKGKVRLQVLLGEIEVLGASIKSTDAEKNIFSPRGYSLLCLSVKASDKPTTPESIDLFKQKLVEVGFKSADVRTKIVDAAQKGSTLVLLSQLGSESDDFVSKHLRHSVGGRFELFGRDSGFSGGRLSNNLNEAEKVLNVNFVVRNSDQEVRSRLYRQNPDWENAVRSVKFTIQDDSQPRVLVAGGKGVGKSTFIRYLVNRILAEVGSPVLVVDLDPGQAEFTVPGCLSSTKVSEPILGPNFTHLSAQKDILLYLGTVDVSSAKARYLKCLDELHDHCAGRLKAMPWIINTMGFNEGLGVHLMKKTAEKFKPTTIVEIESRSSRKNFKPRDFFLNLASSLRLVCNVMKFSAMPESSGSEDFGAQDTWGIPQPSKLRDIVMLSFIQTCFPDCRSLQSIAPRCVSWSEVYVQILNVRESFTVQSLVQILNTGFISLGRLPPGVSCDLKPDRLNVLRSKDIVVASLGFGVIRGIDVERRLFYIITDLDDKTVTDVNCVTLGPTVRLPSGVLIGQKSHLSTLPYVTKNSSKCLLSTPWQKHSKPRPEN